jgi:hypothetical protein
MPFTHDDIDKGIIGSGLNTVWLGQKGQSKTSPQADLI